MQSYRQEVASKTQTLSASLHLQEQVSLLVFAPLWLFPATVKLSHVSLKRVKKQQESILDLSVLKNDQTDLSRLSLDPSILRQFLLVWTKLYQKTNAPPTTAESDHRLVVVQGGVYSKGATIRLMLDLVRFVPGDDLGLKDVLKNVFIFWSCEQDTKYGYLPLYVLLHSYHDFLKSHQILSDVKRVRYSDFIIKDESNTVLKFTMQGSLRVYRIHAHQEVSVVYNVSVSIKVPNSTHQMCLMLDRLMHRLLCGMNEFQQISVFEEPKNGIQWKGTRSVGSDDV